MFSADIASSKKSYKKLEPRIKTMTIKLLNLTKKSSFFVSVYLVDNTTMRNLNRRHRRQNKVTNVLAFPAPKDFRLPPKTPNALGEIYLAPDYIKKEGADPILLLVHGFLHLLGFDHIKKNDRIKMENLEARLLNKTKS